MTWKDEDDRLMQRAWELRQDMSVTSDWAISRWLQDRLRKVLSEIADHRECSVHEIHIRKVK